MPNQPRPECHSCGSELPDDSDILCAACSWEWCTEDCPEDCMADHQGEE